VSTYTLRIEKALNGWIVKAGSDTMVVRDDEDLAGAIAASLVAGRLSDDLTAKEQFERDMQHKQNVLVQKYLDNVKPPPPAVSIGTGTWTPTGSTGQIYEQARIV
jgi:hypothetical protein